MKKKILILAGLISVGYILYRRHKRKSGDRHHDHVTTTDKKEWIDTFQLPESAKKLPDYQPTPEEREHNKSLVQQWLAAHPEQHKKSGRKPGTSGKYALRFNRMSVGSIIHYYNVNSNTIDKIRTAAFKFSMRYNVELRVERIDKNACKVTRIS